MALLSFSTDSKLAAERLESRPNFRPENIVSRKMSFVSVALRLPAEMALHWVANIANSNQPTWVKSVML